MKIKKGFLTVVLFVLCFFLCIVLILSGQKAEGDKIKDKNEGLNYLSNMMKIIANGIEDDKTEYVVLSAEMIKSSGAVSYLDQEKRETVYSFISKITDGTQPLNYKSAVFARRCSSLALSEIKGEDYDLGSLINNLNLINEPANSFKYQNAVRLIDTLEGISLYKSISGENLCARCSNIYYIANIEDATVKERVYITETNISKDENRYLDFDVVKVIEDYFSDTAFFKYTVMLDDENTVFYRCEGEKADYIIGIDKQNKKISHVKKCL